MQLEVGKKNARSVEGISSAKVEKLSAHQENKNGKKPDLKNKKTDNKKEELKFRACGESEHAGKLGDRKANCDANVIGVASNG